MKNTIGVLANTSKLATATVLYYFYTKLWRVVSVIISEYQDVLIFASNISFNIGIDKILTIPICTEDEVSASGNLLTF